jgi:hypothetical protein
MIRPAAHQKRQHLGTAKHLGILLAAARRG